MNQGIYNRGIPEYDRLDADRWMEASWMAKKYAMMSNKGMSATEAGQYATEHLITESIGRNIYNAADNQLFDANGKLTASRLSGYDDLDWADAIERNGHRQDYNLSASTSGEKYSIYSSIGYLKEKGYVKATDYERYSGRINSTFTPNKWFKGGVNLTGSWTKRNYNDNATGSYYSIRSTLLAIWHRCILCICIMLMVVTNWMKMVKRFMTQLLHIWATVISLMKCCSIKKKAFVMY